jgi:hypothetical protein
LIRLPERNIWIGVMPGLAWLVILRAVVLTRCSTFAGPGEFVGRDKARERVGESGIFVGESLTNVPRLSISGAIKVSC